MGDKDTFTIGLKGGYSADEMKNYQQHVDKSDENYRKREANKLNPNSINYLTFRSRANKGD